MNWGREVLRQAVVVRAPFGVALRRFKRRCFGYEPDRDNLLGTLSNLEQMVDAIKAQACSFDGATVLEIGSGWFPAIPIMLQLKGVGRVVMTDQTPYMDRNHSRSDAAPAENRLRGVSSLANLSITYLASFEVGAIPNGSLDFIMSSTVLEHIPRGDLIRLLASLRP